MYIESIDSIISLEPISVNKQKDKIAVVFNKSINIGKSSTDFYFFLQPRCNNTLYYSNIFKFTDRYKSKFTYTIIDGIPIILDIRKDNVTLNEINNDWLGFPNLAIRINYSTL